MTYTIQLRRDTAANWTSDNPVLASGELGIETDTHYAKLGNGVTSWVGLPYWTPSAVTDTDNFDPAGSAATAQANAESYALGLVNELPASLQLVASTGVAGYALTLAGGNILTWTAPNDGNPHYVTVFGNLHVTTTETGTSGGAIGGSLTDPGGNAFSASLDGGVHGVGNFSFNSKALVVGPGTTFTLTQTAMTAGAATLYAAIFAM